MIRETCAITTRVAPSFLRVGHVDLFSRRAVRAGKGTPQFVELEQIVRHAIFREFPDLLKDAEDPESSGVSPAQAAAFLRASGAAISEMVAGWLRVGFCQGNFNADNCLVGGRTMDYGPFGFMDAYDPYFAKWTGSGEHFAFANQPGAGLANFAVLAASVAPLLAGEEDEASDIVREIEGVMETAVSATWRRKLGLDDDVSAADVAKLWDYGLEPLMRAAECDYVVVFPPTRRRRARGRRRDAHRRCTARAVGGRVLRAARRGRAREVGRLDCRAWRAATDALDGGVEGVARRIKAENPKYVLREWMLVEAYTAAKERDDFSVVRELFEVATKPYEEGDDASRAVVSPRAGRPALGEGGTGVHVLILVRAALSETTDGREEDTNRRDVTRCAHRVDSNRAESCRRRGAVREGPETRGGKLERRRQRVETNRNPETRRGERCGPGWCRTERGTACGCSPTRATHSVGRRIRTDRRERARRSIVDPTENVTPREPNVETPDGARRSRG